MSDENESAIILTLGDGATWETYQMVFSTLFTPQGEGYCVSLNGVDGRLVSVTVEDENGEGILFQPSLDDLFENFGPVQFTQWADIHTLEIF